MEVEGGCGWEPPPDAILVIPPPPLPAFLQVQQQPPNVSSDPCLTSPPDLCQAPTGKGGLEFVELPRQVAGLDDTWLLILIACSVGVLLLGTLLAILLLKCREERVDKGELEPEEEVNKVSGGGGGAGCELLYPRLEASSRVLWATLTPRGTTTHRAELKDGFGRFCCPNNNNNYGRVDPYYVEPEPLYSEPDEYLMKVRTRQVSSPTRIENPNLPPLNLHRHTLSRRYPLDHPPLL